MNKLMKNIMVSKQFSTLLKVNRNLCFKSEISLDKLYPQSSLKLHTPNPPESKDGKFSGYIPIDQLKVTYSRSSGPGGQNVNCVNTKVDVRFHVSAATFISQHVKTKLLEVYKNQINREGDFVIKSDVTRSQQMNLADALDKIRTIIRKMEEPESTEPSEETLEKHRKRQQKVARIRLHEKRDRSNIKSDRQNL